MAAEMIPAEVAVPGEGAGPQQRKAEQVEVAEMRNQAVAVLTAARTGF